MKLTGQQEAFVQAVVRLGDVNGCQRKAYMEAYPNCTQDVKNIDSKASNLMKNPKIVARLEELRGKVRASAEKKCIVTTDQVLQQLAEIGLADIRDLYDDEGLPLPPNRLPDRIARCIVGVDTTVVGEAVIYKYRLNPKDKSLALMAQILGMLQPKTDDDDKDLSINITPVYGRDDDG